MATETGRHRLYDKIKEQWGEEHAAELMSYLPPVGWSDVTTKQDLAHVSTDLRAEMAQLGTDLRAEMAVLGSKIDVLGAQLRTEIAGVATEMHKESKSQLRWILGVVLTTQAASIGVFAVIVNWLR